MVMAGPTLAEMERSTLRFAGFAGATRSWDVLTLATSGVIDPAVAGHRKALFTWLNAWGCRLRRPRDGEVDVFDGELAGWWAAHAEHLPAVGESLIGLDDVRIRELTDCFGRLAGMPAVGGARPRALGSTAASKLLHALRPRTLMPWDEAIAIALHGARDSAAFGGHLRIGREWGLALLAESGLDEDALAERLGRPGIGLAKLLDEYCYLRFTSGELAIVAAAAGAD